MKIKLIKKILVRSIVVVIIIGIIIMFVILGINLFMRASTDKNIKTVEECKDMNADCILVLGAGVKNGKPSWMLEDRIITGDELYNVDASPKIIMSGDHGKTDYDEVNIMKDYSIDEGVVSEDIFMDHAGFSTYESLYRAKEIFGAKKIIIVTQKYHLTRALYIAKSLGLEAYGVAADKRDYLAMQKYRVMREWIARVKDFGTSIVKPKPTFLGDKIDLTCSGDVTNDK